MLTELHIENVAVIKNITLRFTDGFSVLTGETGAGKSIIIDSVSLVCGARSSKEMIRSGEESASVTAVFSQLPAKALEKLAELDIYPDEDGNLYLSRVITDDGKTRARIGGVPIPAGTLKEAGKILLNIHGQHDSQQLLMPEKHIEFLDASAGNDALKKEYGEEYAEMLRLRREIKAESRSESEREYLTSKYTSEIKEIDSARLKPGEEKQLEEKLIRLKNHEKTVRCSREIYGCLEGGDDGGNSASELIKRAREAMKKISDTVPDAEKTLQRMEECLLELKDMAESALSLAGAADVDPAAEIDRIENRLETISRLQRRYGETTEDVLRYREETAAKLAGIQGAQERIKELKTELSAAVKRAAVCADKLSESRKKEAKRLSEEITAELRYLDLGKAEFFVSVTPLESENAVRRFSSNGCDAVEFLITTNPGEPLRPLAKVASGGELSRVMLALKSVLIDCDGVSTLIFDEIDTGVSGKTSQKIGLKLKRLSGKSQVFCVTHSAQIAALGDTHYLIEKSETDGRNETKVRQLGDDERVEELSRIMGGMEITETLRRTAREMLDGAKKLSITSKES